jgi:DNA-binding beta-propeller fold protein YncE
VFDKTGHNISSIGRGLFTQLYDVALDSKGNVYTADPDQNKIRKFNNQGDSISQWSAQRPTRILINAQDNLFVVCSSNPYLMTEFDTVGTTIFTDTAVSFMNDIGNMVLGTDGRVFIMEEYTNRILIYNNNLAAKSTASINLGSGYPLLRAVDSLGNFYVFWDDGKYAITVYNSVGSKIAKWQPGLPFDRICFFGGKIYVLGNNAAVNMNMKIIKVFSNPF